jgi:mono/diheme cytochrome c family protein
MKLQTTEISLLISLAILSPPLPPARAADPAHGSVLAARWCASCHVVSAGQPTATEAPTFADIANSPGFDAGRLALFLLDPHPKMPNMSLTRTEAADLAAYIASLAK